MWGFTPWQIIRGVAFDKFVRLPLLKLAELTLRFACWL